ncbi:hypothetical protein CFC21_082143 [Triticum aestivum]|uniref:NADH-ubiquinone oxidoreductase 21kDa subunit N-terminal domain-containing protein n=2 Tax=Triticum aestivum TaxID=4565 RepID=A0A9R1L4Q6_WHEAT|nr:NADH-ubiquinone oxidoreductase 20.9 kDa subunit-like [Triticum aestivum]XP_044407594.1 NADH-ubiquinone oxidoreductase 20.9 kDa subunit-like [Triticum aestivum]KAF7077606.1 hypothetical protein CFC21_082143 [Triticum aestivum]
MNTDITASVKPEYPVVDRNPPFTKVVGNFSTLDYLRLSTISAVSVTVGYLSGIKPGIRGPSMVTGGLIGVLGGFMYAYQNSAGSLMGFFPNESEVARYKYSCSSRRRHFSSLRYRKSVTVHLFFFLYLISCELHLLWAMRDLG